MVPFVTLLAALAAIASPFAQAGPVRRALVPRQQNCAAALILAQGISENIEDQKNEQTALAQVVDVLNQTPVDASAFATAKANLLTFVNNGIAIRQANQLITPLGNKATAGLATVADAQLDELNLSLGLTGDPVKDADAITKLNDGFTNGLKQNEQNLADAMAGCVTNNGVLFSNGTHDAGSGKNNEAKNPEDNKDAGAKDADKAGSGKADSCDEGSGTEEDTKEADRKEAEATRKEKEAERKEADRKQAEADRKEAEAAGKEAGKESDKNANDANAAQGDACD